MSSGHPNRQRRRMRVIGIDLSWGEQQRDGMALLEVGDAKAKIARLWSSQGDGLLLEAIDTLAPPGIACLLAIDAPIVCPNREGSRPVDRLTHVRFGRFHAGCHPVGRMTCPRPPRISRLLQRRGFLTDFRLLRARQITDDNGAPLRRQIEVYPHPATIRLFGLTRIIKYKRGTSAGRRDELSRLQGLVKTLCAQLRPSVIPTAESAEILEVNARLLRGGSRKAARGYARCSDSGHRWTTSLVVRRSHKRGSRKRADWLYCSTEKSARTRRTDG